MTDADGAGPEDGAEGRAETDSAATLPEAPAADDVPPEVAKPTENAAAELAAEVPTAENLVASDLAGAAGAPPADDTASPDTATPAPALLPPDPAAPPGLFGKLPLCGDFLSRNMPRPLLRHLETWLETVMSGARDGLGPDWPATFDASPVWHFWIGGALWGQPCTGALMPSRDGVGRRFPLVLLLADGPDTEPPRCPPPPVIDAAAAWHAACTAFLRAAPGLTDLPTLDAALAALPRPLPEMAAQATLARDPKAAIWAMTPPGDAPPADLATLFADIAASDHALAAQTRSYWWTGHAGDTADAPAQAGAFVALAGLPDAQVFAFLLGGAGTARLANGGGSA